MSDSLILETRELVCIDPDKNHHCYYRVLLTFCEENQYYMVIQQHARIGKRIAKSKNHEDLPVPGIPIPEGNPYFINENGARDYINQTIQMKTSRKRKKYRFLRSNEFLKASEDGAYHLVEATVAAS